MGNVMGLIRDLLNRRQSKGNPGDKVSPTLGKQMVNAGDTTHTDCEERDLTAVFCSIHSYVTLAEQVPLAQLPELMNLYFTACTDTIETTGGTLDKYIGDAVVAMFGAPFHLPDHALQACVAALKIQNQIAGLREKFSGEKDKWPEAAHTLRVRIGLNSGMAVVGTMGSATRFNYTMMGDNVNLAARLESGAKSYGAWTLCTGVTKQACEQAHAGRVVFRSLGQLIVKGRTQPVELFEPLALNEEANAEVRECVSLFESGLARYMAQDWNGAIEYFHRSARLERHQPELSTGIELNPSIAFSRMAARCRQNQPPTLGQTS